MSQKCVLTCEMTQDTGDEMGLIEFVIMCIACTNFGRGVPSITYLGLFCDRFNQTILCLLIHQPQAAAVHTCNAQTQSLTSPRAYKGRAHIPSRRPAVFRKLVLLRCIKGDRENSDLPFECPSQTLNMNNTTGVLCHSSS